MREKRDLHCENCRNQIIDGNSFLITEVGISENDKHRLSVNCDGFGRIRTFKRKKEIDWIDNPLPFDPYSISMGKEAVDELKVQVFQLAKCNLNCWWCFLPDKYKTCDVKYTRWFSVPELVNMYISEASNNTNVIDLSGGNPELVPEFIYQFMTCLERENLSEKVYLWSDDVLSTDFFITKLQSEQIDYIVNYNHYGKVACFKGIDDESYCFNTCKDISGFQFQLEMAKKYIELGLDIYFYIVLTVPNLDKIDHRISKLFDTLQLISYYLPLRIVPIKIKTFQTNIQRLNSVRNASLSYQYNVLESWKNELTKRYNSTEINRNISLISL